MKRIGDEIYIQRGEVWSLDFEVINRKGAPLMLLKNWKNPYLAITVTAALYEQPGDFRQTYWLDLNQRWVERADGTFALEPVKRFIFTEPLFTNAFDIEEILTHYGVDNGGKIVLNKSSDFDITNCLFYTDPQSDGNYIYKYVKDYHIETTVQEIPLYEYDDELGAPRPVYDDSGKHITQMVADRTITAEWEDYNFRIVKQFTTRDWLEQGYLFDAKILAGETVQEHIAGLLDAAGYDYEDLSLGNWSDTQTQEYINLIGNPETRAKIQEIYASGVPLMPDYDVKSLILQPTKLYVSVNIQGGIS